MSLTMVDATLFPVAVTKELMKDIYKEQGCFLSGLVGAVCHGGKPWQEHEIRAPISSTVRKQKKMNSVV